uniref:Uncharacterized protein n=1 Tax=Setaria italica TaxID=4555 RepID=K3Z221_SETIT
MSTAIASQPLFVSLTCTYVHSTYRYAAPPLRKVS